MNNIIVRNISSPIPKGSLCVITGDFYEENLKVILKGDGQLFECLPSNKKNNHSLTVRLPEDKFRSYELWVESGNEKSNSMFFNLPRVAFYTNEENVLRLFGNGLVNLDCYNKDGFCDYVENYTSVRLYSNENDYKPRIVKANGYNIFIDISGIPKGNYFCTVNNGVGESEAINVELKEAADKTDFVVNAVECGMIDVEEDRMNYKMPENRADRDFTFLGVKTERTTREYDSSKGLQRALDMCRDNGGGTVFVPNGRYRFFEGVTIYPNTRIVGETKERVYFETPTGLGSEDGFGTPEEGMAIDAFIRGSSDFTLENLNIMCVYSPTIISAPYKEIKTTDEKYLYDKNGRRIFYDIIDITKTAKNIVIKNCYINHEPSYFSQRKDNSDPLYTDEKWDGQGKATKLGGWHAVLIAGEDITIENSFIKGGGRAITLYGAENVNIRNNELYSGSYANVITMFSSDYYLGNDSWHKMCKNIIIEKNKLGVFSNLSTSINWIMEEHINYYIADNEVLPRFWVTDSEGFNFHLWGDSLHIHCDKGEKNQIFLNKEELKTQFDKVSGMEKYLEADGSIKDGAFNGWECVVTSGRGMGQLFCVKESIGNKLIIDTELDTVLDSDSEISVRQFKFFNNTYVLNNKINECGRAIYYWGCGFNSYVDGNTLRKNAGIVFEDLSKIPERRRIWTQFAGNYFNQIIANKVTEGRGFASNICTIGASTGGVSGGTVSLIVRSNIAENDVSYAAYPRIKADGEPNYTGIVFEKNTCKNAKVGFYLGAGVEAVLSDNILENVDTAYAGNDLSLIEGI